MYVYIYIYARPPLGTTFGAFVFFRIDVAPRPRVQFSQTVRHSQGIRVFPFPPNRPARTHADWDRAPAPTPLKVSSHTRDFLSKHICEGNCKTRQRIASAHTPARSKLTHSCTSTHTETAKDFALAPLACCKISKDLGRGGTKSLSDARSFLSRLV